VFIHDTIILNTTLPKGHHVQISTTKYPMQNPIQNINLSTQPAILKRNLPWLLISSLLMGIIYLTTNHISHQTIYNNYLFDFETHIPFLAWTVLPYFGALFWSFMIPLFVENRQHLMVILSVNGIGFLFNTFIWVMTPVSYPRPQLRFEDPSLTEYLYQSLIVIDTPLNSFPSEHVTLMAILIWVASAYSGKLKWFFIFLGVCGILSVFTTKQHSLVDAIAGCLAMFIGYILVIIYVHSLRRNNVRNEEEE
jgi:hypothetical protein